MLFVAPAFLSDYVGIVSGLCRYCVGDYVGILSVFCRYFVGILSVFCRRLCRITPPYCSPPSDGVTEAALGPPGSATVRESVVSLCKAADS